MRTSLAFVGILFHCFYAHSFENVEKFLPPVLSSKGSRIALKVKEEHEKLGSLQQELSHGLSQISPSAPTSSSASVASSSSRGKSVVEDWGKTNFALATLLVVTRSEEIIPIDIYPVPLLGEGEFSRIYDSCFDLTHNAIPDLQACKGQWQKYLPENAFIRGADTNSVEQKINTSLQDIKSNTRRIREATAEEAESIPTGTKAILKNIKTYHDFMRTWVKSGWHTEQRIIFDLDQERILLALRGLKDRLQEENNSIEMIVGCLHTKFSPCALSKTCDCLVSLINWPEQWEFHLENPGIPVLMTVSYETPYFKSTAPEYAPYRELSNSSRHFFMQPISLERRSSPNTEMARYWATQGLLSRQLNGFRNEGLPISRYETKLFAALCPLIKSAIEISYEFSQDFVECRSFQIKVQKLVLKRNYSQTKGYKLYQFFDNPISNGHTIGDKLALFYQEDEEIEPFTLYASATDKTNGDSDWALLVKILGMLKLKELHATLSQLEE